LDGFFPHLSINVALQPKKKLKTVSLRFPVT